MKRIIALITDFGESDYFVGSMKGVILSINPEVEIVDITHNITPFDIFEAGFVLKASFSYFPQKTIFIIVVDPEVGSKRRILLAYYKNYYFITPDNGLLSFVINEKEEAKVISVTSSHYFLSRVSNTFHGRDIMAPVSAWLARGINISSFGELCSDWLKLKFPEPMKIDEKSYEGEIIHIDRFGNLITNIPSFILNTQVVEKRRGLKVEIGGREIEKFVKNYSEGSVGEPVLVIGSADFLEIGAFLQSAEKILKVKKGDKFRLYLL